MKTTIDIPDDLLAKTMKYAKVDTKREAVLAAMEEYTRRHEVEKVIATFGTFKDFMTQDDLREMRTGRDKRHNAQRNRSR